MRTQAEKRYFAEHPEELERQKMVTAKDILKKLEPDLLLTFVSDDKPYKCETCNLPNVSEVRCVPSEYLLEFVQAWVDSKGG